MRNVRCNDIIARYSQFPAEVLTCRPSRTMYIYIYIYIYMYTKYILTTNRQRILILSLACGICLHVHCNNSYSYYQRHCRLSSSPLNISGVILWHVEHTLKPPCALHFHMLMDQITCVKMSRIVFTARRSHTRCLCERATHEFQQPSVSHPEKIIYLHLNSSCQFDWLRQVARTVRCRQKGSFKFVVYF